MSGTKTKLPRKYWIFLAINIALAIPGLTFFTIAFFTPDHRYHREGFICCVVGIMLMTPVNVHMKKLKDAANAASSGPEPTAEVSA